jgi:hypothetical protein
VSVQRDRRLATLEARIQPRREPFDIPEWVHWATCDELMRLEALYRRAADAGEDEMSESDQHHAMAVYSAAMARMLDAPPEVRADPEARGAYVREIEDRDRPRWYP